MAGDLYKELRGMAKGGEGIIRPRIKGTYIGFDLEQNELDFLLTNLRASLKGL